MKCYTTTLLLVISTLSIASAFQAFVPNGKELVYEYRAFFKAGALLPMSYASECFLRAKLHLQSANNTILMRLSDAKYRLYNGQRYYGHERDADELPVPDQLTDLFNTFKVVYHKNGQAQGIITEQDEEPHAQNVHKAIASTLQLNTEKILSESRAFTTEEQSIHGKTSAFYVVEPDGDSLNVKKMQEKLGSIGPSSNREKIVMSKISSINPTLCEAQFEEPTSRNAHQTYVVGTKNGRRVVSYVESSGGIYVYPFQFKSEGQYIYVTVTSNLLGINSIPEVMRVESEGTMEDLSYQVVSRVIDAAKLYEMLEETAAYLRDNHLDTQQPDIEHGQLVNRMVQLLQGFNQAQLEKMHDDLSDRSLQIYHQLLPLVGTHASVVHVKHIIKDKMVEETVALQMLFSLPLHVRAPLEQMLEDVADMLTWDNELSVDVRSAAILAFSSLIRAAYQQNNHKIQLYEKYITDFAGKIGSTQDLNTQILYIQALHNTRLPTIVKHLQPIVERKTKQSVDQVHHHIRRAAVWALAPVVMDNPIAVLDLYWPLFIDRSEQLELRAAAYYIIMQSRPPPSRLLNVFWEMQGKPDAELYHFHYTYLQTMARSTDPCHKTSQLYAAQFLKFTPKPKRPALLTYRKMDYVDDVYKFGADYNTVFVVGDSVTVLKFEANSQMLNVRWNDYSLSMEIHGLNRTIQDQIQFSFNNYDKLWNLISCNIDNIGIQILIGRNSQTIQTYYYDAANVQDFNLYNLLQNFHFSLNSIEIHYDAFTEIVIPTEMGVPAVIEILSPAIHHKRIKVDTNIFDDMLNIHLDNQFRISRQAHYGISLYNPILDVWQGSNRYHSYDLVLPFYSDISIDAKQRILKITIKRHDDQQEDVAGLRSHVTTMTFVRDDSWHDVLKKSCSKCQNWAIVTKGQQYRQDYTLYHNDFYNTGYNYSIAVYDSEIPANNDSLYNFFHKLVTKHNRNYQTPFEYVTLFLHHWHTLTILQPPPGSHGILVKAIPISTQIDLTLHINAQLAQPQNEYLPGIQLNAHATYTLTNEDETTWTMNATIDVNPGHTTRNVQLDLTHTENACQLHIDSTKKWTEDGVKGHFNLAIGNGTNDATMEIAILGKQLLEQKATHHSYEVCQPYSHDQGLDYYSMFCAAAHSSVRNYTYDIVVKHLPWLGRLIPKPNGHARASIEYSMADEIDIEVVSERYSYKQTEIPIRKLFHWGFIPDNLRYSMFYMMLQRLALIHTCIVNYNSALNQQEWMLYVGDGETDVQHGVFLKRLEGGNLLALRAVHKNQTLDVYPDGKHGNQFKIVLNGNEMTNIADYHAEDGFSYLIRPHVHGVIVTTFYLQLHIEYTPKQVTIEIPNVNVRKLYGHCIKDDFK